MNKNKLTNRLQHEMSVCTNETYSATIAVNSHSLKPCIPETLYKNVEYIYTAHSHTDARVYTTRSLFSLSSNSTRSIHVNGNSRWCGAAERDNRMCLERKTSL